MINGINGCYDRAPHPGDLGQKLFNRADVNGDGKITKEELTALISKEGRGPSAETIFKVADSDGDGKITPTELENAMIQMFDAAPSKVPDDPPKGEGGYDQTGAPTSGPAASRFSAVA